MNQNKLRIKEVHTSGDPETPRYSISFIPSERPEENRRMGREIITALKGKSDAIVEIKSSFLNAPPNEREELVTGLVKTVKSLGADYRYRKTAEQKKSFLSNLLNFGGKPGENHELLLYMPNGLWEDESFTSRLPNSGVRYNIFKEGTDGVKILDELYNGQLLDEEKEGIFELAVFDGSSFGQMGIFSDKPLAHIKSKLKLP